MKQIHLIYYTKKHSQVRGGHSRDRERWSVKHVTKKAKNTKTNRRLKYVDS